MARRAKTAKSEAEAVAAEAELRTETEAPMAESAPQVPAEPMMAPAMASQSSGNGKGRGRKGLLSRMYGDVGETRPEERERVAAMEWQQAMAPVMELLQSSVPEAQSPEDAARIWEERGGPILPDPNGGSYIPGDAFETDARVYYRLLRRDYEKDPRPGSGPSQPYYLGKMAKSHNKSHYLPAPYGQRPGIKGW